MPSFRVRTQQSVIYVRFREENVQYERRTNFYCTGDYSPTCNCIGHQQARNNANEIIENETFLIKKS